MKQPDKMVSSEWPKVKRRLDQIGRELTRDNNEQPQIQGNINLSLSLSQSSSSSSSPAPSTIMTKKNFPLKKNMFFANPDEPAITTDRQPDDVFQELEFIGYGSSGTVSKKRHIPTGKECAVKVMRKTLNEDQNKTIYMDLQTVLKCKSDNIVRCCGYFMKDVEVWICTELMTTCCHKLLKARNKALPEDFVGAVAASTVKALNYLKENHQIIHRDVKPSNILIDDQGRIKLCDFGISGYLVNSVAKTRTVGCVPYMAPERLQHSSSTYNIRSDVWSLGITLLELATGKLPYEECENDFNIILKIIYDVPPSLPENMDFSPDFRHLINQCLAKEPEDRPDYKQLLEHPFIKKHMDTLVNINELDQPEATMDYDDHTESFEVIE